MADEHEVLQSLRSFAATQSEVGRHFARTQRLHPTDAAAIVEILSAEERGLPLTPARLAERLGLTTGATSTLLNRLEDAGHIARTREHADRRMVTLHSAPAVHETAGAYFQPLAEQLTAAISGYSAAELALVDEIVTKLREAAAAYLESREA